MSTATRRVFGFGLLLALLVGPASAPAQSELDPGAEFPFESDRSEIRLYVGMWTSHLRNVRGGLDNNWLVGVRWRGIFGGTFVNSYGKRAYTAGIQRTMAGATDGSDAPSVGLRLGLVTGYDERFLSLASKSPVIPLAQVVGDVGKGPTRFELAWAGLIASLTPSVRF